MNKMNRIKSKLVDLVHPVRLLSPLGVLCAFVVNAVAAPPSLTSLYPAGAQRGTTVEVAAAGTLDPWPVTVWASGPGVTVETAKDKGKLKVTVAADAVPGPYWLRAHNADGASGLRPFFVGMLPEVTETEPNDTCQKPQSAGPAVVVNGRLEKAGDVDCFAVSVRKGQTLVASLEANRTLKSPMDAILQVVSTDGFVLDQNHDYRGLDPQVAYTAPKDGTYVARVFAFPATPDSSIRFSGGEAYVYRLTLTTGEFADHTWPLAANRTTPGSVRLEGWNITEANQSLPAAADAGESFPIVRPGLAGLPRVVLEPHSTSDASRAADPMKVHAPPVSTSGRLSAAGKVDRFTVAGKKGQRLDVQVRSESLGLAVAPAVRLLGPTGAELAKAEPAKLHTDVALAYTPTADGPITVTVGDLFNGAGFRHAYLLRVVPAQPDYELTVAADRFTATVGKPLAIPLKVVRKNGFAKPVDVTGIGLPDGVKLTVTAPAKPDPATVTVTLTADKAVSGPFRLVGQVKGEPQLKRTARMTTPDSDEATSDLWLTAKK
jgi:hypothetical protein